MARPTKLTAECGERIEKAVRAGNYLDSAARSAGVHPSTLYRWLERGEREEGGIYHDFAAAVRRAEAEAEVHAVAVLRKAMADDWRASLVYLERRHPEGWRRRETRELTGGGPIRGTRGKATKDRRAGRGLTRPGRGDRVLRQLPDLHRQRIVPQRLRLSGLQPQHSTLLSPETGTFAGDCGDRLGRTGALSGRTFPREVARTAT